MKSKTQISKQESKKTNSELVETIRETKNQKEWMPVASVLAGPRSNWKSVNIGTINNKIKEGEKIIVLGKVLSQGEVSKKFKVVAFGFSESAEEKLKKSGCEISTISEEVKKNPHAKDLKIL
jgi:large subunit ribosomal protein L18e